MELDAAVAPPSRAVGAPPFAGEAAAMLVRRALRPRATRPNLPFPRDFGEDAATRVSKLLGHYAFRLFHRGAIQKPEGFAAEDATRYVPGAAVHAYAEALVEIGLARPLAANRYRLTCPATTFGPILEWYVARELARRFRFDVAAGVKFRAHGVGGDLDVVAAAEGKLVYLELNSSPPKHLSEAEIRAFFDRLRVLRPDITLFVVDTALRLSDKVVPMLVAELQGRSRDVSITARRVRRELWAVTPHVYAVNSNPDLMRNIGRAIAEGLAMLAPTVR